MASAAFGEPPAVRAEALTGRRAWVRRAPLMPALVYMIIVTQIPFLVTLWYSLRSWNTSRPARTGGPA